METTHSDSDAWNQHGKGVKPRKEFGAVLAPEQGSDDGGDDADDEIEQYEIPIFRATCAAREFGIVGDAIEVERHFLEFRV